MSNPCVSILSYHAKQRIEERFLISHEEFLNLLNSGLWKKIGISAVHSIEHRLLWSTKDEIPLVAIQECVTGIVLTVLTIGMYTNTYQDNLTEKRLKKLLNKMVIAGHLPNSRWSDNVDKFNAIVYAFHYDSAKRIPLGAFRSDTFLSDLSDLGENPEFWKWVAKQLIQRGYSLEKTSSVGAHIKGGDYQEIPFG